MSRADTFDTPNNSAFICGIIRPTSRWDRVRQVPFPAWPMTFGRIVCVALPLLAVACSHGERPRSPATQLRERSALLNQGRTVQVTTPSDNEIVLVQTLVAPREAVFAAFTNAEQLATWLKPTAMSLVSCEVDLRVGGKLRYVFERPNGRRIEVRGTFGVVERPHRFVYVESYDFSPLKVQVTTSLEEAGETTILTQTLRYASQQERDKDYPGVTESAKEVFTNLDRYLTKRDR